MTEATPKYEWPVVERTIRPERWVAANARPLIYELLGRTERFGDEHGVSFWADGVRATSFYSSEIVSGTEEWVNFSDPPVEPPVQFSLHTHPSGVLSLSTQDWSSLAAQLLQYPPAVAREWRTQDTLRGDGIVAQRLGEPERDIVSVKVVAATEAADKLSIEESKDISQQLMSDSTTEVVGPDGIEPPYDEFLTMITQQIPLPAPAEELHYKSAVPDAISDREFGNAFAEGDLSDLLRGVTYE